jgi:hypothetical protein
MNKLLEPHVTELEQTMKHQLGSRIRNLRVIPRGEGVVLQGSSRTYYAKQLAQEAVLTMQQFPLVANEIQVIQDQPSV